MPPRPATTSTPPTLSRRASSIASTTLSLPRAHILLDNQGSTARDHLGIERTLLAWLRLSLTLLAVSIFMFLGLRLDPITTISFSRSTTTHSGMISMEAQHAIQITLGWMTAVASMLALIISTYKYIQVQNRLYKTREWLWMSSRRSTHADATVEVEEDASTAAVKMGRVMTLQRIVFAMLVVLVAGMTLAAVVLDWHV